MEQQDSDMPYQTGSPVESQSAPMRRRWRMRQIVGLSLVSLLCLSFLAILGSQLLTPAPKQTAWASPLIGHPAPDFTLPMLSANPASGQAASFHLASVRGKPLILNFWASWCLPCKDEAPLLATSWASALQPQGILMLGIDFQDTRSDGLAFLQKYAILYPNVVDSSGSTAINYGVSAVPETFFINRQGIIVSKVVGELSEQSLQKNVHLLVQPSP
jgi:cytochrome c biogenesis protein CcmG, thiol:disulfide interchange protein DsbE